MIWYYIYNLKNVRNTHGGVLLLVKLHAKACNFTKSNTLPWLFFTFFILYEWYQIAQRTTYKETIKVSMLHFEMRKKTKKKLTIYIKVLCLNSFKDQITLKKLAIINLWITKLRVASYELQVALKLRVTSYFCWNCYLRVTISTLKLRVTEKNAS